MRKIILLFIVVIFTGCASPGSLRQDGPAFVFTATKGTPQEFGRCLVNQLDEIFYLNTHILRDNPNGNATILTIAGGQELKFMFDINKAVGGLNILIYFAWCNEERCRDYAIFPLVTKALNACDAKENIDFRK